MGLLRKDSIFLSVASIGALGRDGVLLRTAPVPGAFALKNALENGHFSPLSAGP
jgi:hypothetical protein